MPFHYSDADQPRDRQALIELFAMPPRRRPGDIRGGQQRFIQGAGGGGGAGPTSRVPQVKKPKYPPTDRPLQTLKRREQSITSGRPGVKESQAGRNLIDLGLDLDELDVENPYGFLQGEDINSEAEINADIEALEAEFADLQKDFQRLAGRPPTPDEMKDIGTLENLIDILKDASGESTAPRAFNLNPFDDEIPF